MESTGTEPAPQAKVQAPPAPPTPDGQRLAALGLVVLIAVAPLTLAAFAALFEIPIRRTSFSGVGIASGVLHEVSSLLLLVYVLHRQGRNLESIGLSFDLADFLRGLGLMVGALLASGFLRMVIRYLNLAGGVSSDVRDPHIFAGISLSNMLVYFVTSSVFEETIVRAYVTTELISLSCPVWLATVASILLQTSYHLYYGLDGALGLSGVFIVFGVYFARSRRLMPIILGHMFVDVNATLQLFAL